MSQNYPNPFNSNTVIKYEIPTESYVTLKLFDILGNEVAILVDEFRMAGSYESEFGAEYLSSGIYFYILRAEDLMTAKKMIS